MTELKVGDVMLPPDRVPVVDERRMFKEVLEEMTRFRLGIASIVDAGGTLLGVFTDGDIRRMLLRDQKPFAALFADDAIQHAVRNPTTTHPDARLADAVRLMEQREIWDLPVVDGAGKLVGLLHLHPSVKRLLAI
jgi:arabinose-5-phosphate isomerase